MGIKNAGKAKIKKNLGKAPTKETVDTPISECEAENPLECRFHGLQALEQQLSAVLPSLGYKIPFGTDKLQGGKGYEIRLDGNVDVEKTGLVDSLMIAFKQQGWDLTYNGKIEGAGHSFYLKKGNGKIEKPSDKDNADQVDSSKPPKDDDAFGEDFDALLEEAEAEEPTKSEDIDLMEYIGNPDKLKESDISDFDALLEEDMGDFDTLLEEAEGEADETPTWEEIKDFLAKSSLSQNPAKSWETMVLTGKFPSGNDIDEDYKKKFNDAIAEFPSDNKVVKAIKKWMDAAPDETEGAVKEPATPSMGGGSDSTEEKKGEMSEGDAPKIMGGLDESLMKPLEHDESKFPQNLTQEKLEAAISKGTTISGESGLKSAIVEIDGKKYVAKVGSKGKDSARVKNGFNADMAYRAGGVYAPDAKFYKWDDGRGYKLSEYIEGDSLIDVWREADEEKRDEIRKDLLHGFPLDILFSNYDVLGTNKSKRETVYVTGADGEKQKTRVAFDNIIVGKDGHCYRVDNDSAFFMRGTGTTKSSDVATDFTKPVEHETWDEWGDRKWIDEFRTYRRYEANAGMFDRYSTADVFLAAGNINLDAVDKSLPESIQRAIARPLFEMKQMTFRAVNLSLGGYDRNRQTMSDILDASYEAEKEGLREVSSQDISWDNPGFGKTGKWTKYQPKEFAEKAPEKPIDPMSLVTNTSMKNEEYTGGKVAEALIKAAKTINHHAGYVIKDEKGNVVGAGHAMKTPDYKAEKDWVSGFERIDRERLAELAKNDKNAAILLSAYDAIAKSKANGWKIPIGLVPKLTIEAKLPAGFKNSKELAFEKDKEGEIAKYKKEMKKWEKDYAEWEIRRDAHNATEQRKAKESGGIIDQNFHAFCRRLMEMNRNTDGVKVKSDFKPDLKFVEASMGSQKGSSSGSDSLINKGMELIMSGMSFDEVTKLSDNSKVYYGKYIANQMKAKFGDNPAKLHRYLRTFALYKGYNMVKMENERCSLFDKASGCIAATRVMGSKTIVRNGKTTSLHKGENAPYVTSGGDCMGFNIFNSQFGEWHQMYFVPLSKICYFHGNQKADAGGYGYYSEQEIVGNLEGLPAYISKGSVSECQQQAKNSPGIAKMLAGWAKRLKVFNTFV